MSRSTFSDVAMKVASPVSKRTCSPSNRMDSSCPAIQIVPVPSGTLSSLHLVCDYARLASTTEIQRALPAFQISHSFHPMISCVHGGAPAETADEIEDR
jgi:hypothetical protein